MRAVSDPSPERVRGPRFGDAMGKRQTRRSYSLPGELYETLRRHAARRGYKPTQYLVKIITDHLKAERATFVDRAEWLRMLDMHPRERRSLVDEMRLELERQAAEFRRELERAHKEIDEANARAERLAASAREGQTGSATRVL
jgi:hypothetical protein